MGDDPMRKADLMDEIRSKIGVVADKLEGDIEALYRYVIETLYEHVPTYRYVGIYLTDQKLPANSIGKGGKTLDDFYRIADFPFKFGFNPFPLAHQFL